MALSTEDRKFLDGILEGSSGLESPVLFLLHKLQDRYAMISSDHVHYLAKELGRPPSELFSAVTFYDEFRLEHAGKFVVRVCRGISCHSLASSMILDALKQKLGIEDGGTTEDGLITLEGASCIGQCDGGPAMMVNHEVYRNLDAGKALSIIDNLIKEGGGSSGQ